MPRKALPYAAGAWFAVPLKTGGFALGVVARADGRGVVLGYFFGPRYVALPAGEHTQGLRAADAVLVERFGDLGLIHGEWPIIQRECAWNPADWPVPVFARISEDNG